MTDKKVSHVTVILVKAASALGLLKTPTFSPDSNTYLYILPREQARSKTYSYAIIPLGYALNKRKTQKNCAICDLKRKNGYKVVVIRAFWRIYYREKKNLSNYPSKNTQLGVSKHPTGCF